MVGVWSRVKLTCLADDLEMYAAPVADIGNFER
jgi:hypothetical protein